MLSASESFSSGKSKTTFFTISAIINLIDKLAPLPHEIPQN